MIQYIDKSALVAEIEKIREHIKRLHYAVDANCIVTVRNACECLDSSIDLFVNSLDTIEVKEVDLKNELKEDWLFADKTEVDCLESMCLTEDMFVSLAKKYFELGLKAQKGE